MAECDAPGASVAKVAMSHGINANIVHRWRQLARQARPALPGPPSTRQFVPVALAARAGTDQHGRHSDLAAPRRDGAEHHLASGGGQRLRGLGMRVVAVMNAP